MRALKPGGHPRVVQKERAPRTMNGEGAHSALWEQI